MLLNIFIKNFKFIKYKNFKYKYMYIYVKYKPFYT